MELVRTWIRSALYGSVAALGVLLLFAIATDATWWHWWAAGVFVLFLALMAVDIILDLPGRWHFLTGLRRRAATGPVTAADSGEDCDGSDCAS